MPSDTIQFIREQLLCNTGVVISIEPGNTLEIKELIDVLQDVIEIKREVISITDANNDCK